MRQKFTDGMIDGSSLVNTPVPETKIDPVAFVKSFGVSSSRSVNGSGEVFSAV